MIHTSGWDIADAAYFLGFDGFDGFYGLFGPSAWWLCSNLIIFTDRAPPGQIDVMEEPDAPISWVD